VGGVRLGDLVTGKPAALTNVTNLRPVLDMDVLWLDGHEVVRAFEVECTTTMTSGLKRGSNLLPKVPKTMVIPEEREKDFERKMNSPLFSEHFNKDNWTLPYFNTLREAFTRTKSKTPLEALLGQKQIVHSRKKSGEANGCQKLIEFGGAYAPEPPQETLESAAVDE
jgi:hypothetical protein